MNVKPHEGLHRFFVSSSGTDPEMAGLDYLVDLAAEHGIGRCGCKHWLHRISPRITAGEHPIDLFDELFTCQHIAAARRYQYEELFWKLMELEPPEVNT